MADVLHSTLTGSDLHECKGADSAALGQVPIASGSGTAPFGNLNYSFLTGTPVVPALYFNGSAVAGSPKIYTYVLTATGGAWSQGISGITTLYGVQVTALSTGSTYATSAIATVASATTATISGSVIVNGAIPTTGSITVYLTVYGV